jgi:putative CocE/NonD family hydrolase
MGRRSWQISQWSGKAYVEQQEYYEALPFADAAERADVDSKWWREYMRHPNYDDFWRAGGYGPHSKMRVPALNVSGWWDLNFPGAPENFEGMRREGATEESRVGAKLVIGPWAHKVNNSRFLSGIDFGEQAVIELDEYVIRFFDRWLKGIENGIEREDPVYVYVINANEWRAESDWPLPGTEYVPFYFHSEGHANSLLGDGVLSTQEPTEGGAEADEYDYDPETVGRTLWRLVEGPVDDRLATARNDVLCYTTKPLTEPLEVIGWVTCQLHAASSALDTDWHARLVDVSPDGTARFLCHGVLRARFRESLKEPSLLEPGVPTFFEFTMDATGIRFLPGHRIRVEITSSWFTQFARNLNTGAENPYEEKDAVVAHQTVFHRPGLASRILLPVVPPAEVE